MNHDFVSFHRWEVAKQSDKYIGYLYQSGINLPDRDYYLKDDDKFKDIRKLYDNDLKTIKEAKIWR